MFNTLKHFTLFFTYLILLITVLEKKKYTFINSFLLRLLLNVFYFCKDVQKHFVYKKKPLFAYSKQYILFLMLIKIKIQFFFQY